MKYQKGNSVAAFLAALSIWLIGAIGWGLNIYHLYHAVVDESVASAVVRGIGVLIAPAGAVMGYLPF